MEVVIDSSCRLSVSDVDEPEEELLCTQFVMDINVEARKQTLEVAGDVIVCEKKRGLKLDIWMYEKKSRSALAGELSRLYLPDQICDSMVDKIVADALRTAKQTRSVSDCMILHLVVDIFFHVVTVPFAFEPASKSAIEELERARVEVPTVCSVCLETMVVGLDATRMPCSHLYHGGCIVKWLGQSRFCPLCRFSMPIETLPNVA